MLRHRKTRCRGRSSHCRRRRTVLREHHGVGPPPHTTKANTISRPVTLVGFKHVDGNILRTQPHLLLQHLNDRDIKDPLLVEGAVLVETELQQNGI
jgi:hypothetical protein